MSIEPNGRFNILSLGDLPLRGGGGRDSPGLGLCLPSPPLNGLLGLDENGLGPLGRVGRMLTSRDRFLLPCKNVKNRSVL